MKRKRWKPFNLGVLDHGLEAAYGLAEKAKITADDTRRNRETYALSRTKWYQGILDASSWSAEGITFRSKHVALTDCHSIVLEYGNFYQDDDPVRLADCVPFDLTVAVQVEGSARFYDVTWDGNTKETFNPGARIKSDPIGMELSKGQSMIVSVFFQGTKFPHGLVSQISNGEGARTGNLLKSTTFSPTSQAILNPLAIYAKTADVGFETIACIGDSISLGASFGNEVFTGYPQGELGFMQLAAMQSGRGYISLGMNGQALDGFEPYKRLRRMDLASRCDIALINYGTNDLTGTKTISQLQAYYLDVWKAAKMRGMRVYQTTITPRTTSTDSWVTVGKQSPLNARFGFGSSSDRAVLNKWIRSIPSEHLDGYIEVADIVETSRDSGVWKPGTTPDGIHPNRDMHLLIAEAVKKVIK